MAYAGVVTVANLGDGNYEIQIADTEAASGSEKEIVWADFGLPVTFRVFTQAYGKVSGTCVTMNPILTRVTASGLGTDIVAENLTAAEQGLNLVAGDGSPDHCITGSLFHRPRPNAGTNNVLRTTYRIRRGWVG